MNQVQVIMRGTGWGRGESFRTLLSAEQIDQRLATGGPLVFLWDDPAEPGCRAVEVVFRPEAIEAVIVRPGSVEHVSDGHHTFGELYDHRRALTVALCQAVKGQAGAWRSRRHHPDDGPMFDDSFIVGIDLGPDAGVISYHYGIEHWGDFSGVIELEHAPRWDGAPSTETVDRLLAWASSQ